jgi:hypothetical protein
MVIATLSTRPLVAEEILRFFDVIQFEPMGDERFKVHAARGDHIGKLSHPFFGTRASSRDDFKAANSLAKRLNWNGEIVRVNAYTRQRAGRTGGHR